jgi:hypothetical protein
MLAPHMTKVGGEVDAFCGKCELVLAHTVHAVVGGKPARVECNTCHATHKYRGPPGGAAAPSGSVARAKASRPARERKQEVSFDQLLAARQRPPVAYSTKHVFRVDDVVEHPTFGIGFVTAVRPDKMDVTFRSDTRVLVHARG